MLRALDVTVLLFLGSYCFIIFLCCNYTSKCLFTYITWDFYLHFSFKSLELLPRFSDSYVGSLCSTVHVVDNSDRYGVLD